VLRDGFDVAAAREGIAAIAAFGLAIAALPAHAQLTSAELSLNIDAGVSADDVEFPFETQSFSDGPRNEDIFLESATIPWDIFVASGGAQSGSTGQLTYLATNTSQIFTRGEFDFSALAAPPASAIAGFDAVLSIDFQVAVTTTFTITGHVSTVRALDAPEVISCQYNGVVLAGDSRATPLTAGTYVIDAERTLYPDETGSLECAAASSGALTDGNTLVWEVAVNGLPEPGSALASIAACISLASLARRRSGSRRNGAASSRARARRTCRWR
jgi:hypothetical protein